LSSHKDIALLNDVEDNNRRYLLSELLSLISHGISEVREGIINGCLCLLKEDKKSSIKVLLYFNKFELIRTLLNQIIIERVPPILRKATKLLSLIVKIVPFATLSADVQQLYRESYYKLSKLVTFSGDNISPEIVLRPTLAAAFVLEILGWIASSFIGNCDERNENFLKEQALLSNWIHLVVTASEIDQALCLRTAAVNSIFSSNILEVTAKLAAESNSHIAVHRNDSDGITSYSLILNLGVYAWIAIAKLMQDDDEDVRSLSNGALSAGIKGYPNRSFQKVEEDNRKVLEYVLPEDLSKIPLLSLESVGTGPLKDLLFSYSLVSSAHSSHADSPFFRCFKFIADEIFSGTKNIKDITDSFCYQSELNDSECQGKFSEKIFEAEQENLHAEAQIYTKVLISAVAGAIKLLTGTKSSSTYPYSENVKSALSNILNIIFEPIMERTFQAYKLLRIFHQTSFDCTDSIDFMLTQHFHQFLSYSTLDDFLSAVNSNISEFVTVRALRKINPDINLFDWIGGPSYHQDVFESVYCNLLSFRMLVSAIHHLVSNTADDIAAFNVFTHEQCLKLRFILFITRIITTSSSNKCAHLRVNNVIHPWIIRELNLVLDVTSSLHIVDNQANV
jgi:hypothetical protein